MTVIGKAVHYSLDLLLISTALAGIKRNTGLTPKKEIVESAEIQGYFQKYLDAGEYVYDTSVGFMNASQYFVRK